MKAITLTIVACALLLVSGCGGPRVAPNAMLESYDSVVVARSAAPLRDRVDPEFQKLSLSVFTEGDPKLTEAVSSRAMMATFRVKNGFLSAGAWLELRDYQTNELLFSTSDKARFWINGKARAARGAVGQLRAYYHGFSPHLYEVRTAKAK